MLAAATALAVQSRSSSRRRTTPDQRALSWSRAPRAGEAGQVALEGHRPAASACRPSTQRSSRATSAHAVHCPPAPRRAGLPGPGGVRCADCATTEVRTCAGWTETLAHLPHSSNMAPAQSAKRFARRVEATRTRSNAPALREWNLMLLYWCVTVCLWGVDAAIAGFEAR